VMLLCELAVALPSLARPRLGRCVGTGMLGRSAARRGLSSEYGPVFVPRLGGRLACWLVGRLPERLPERLPWRLSCRLGAALTEVLANLLLGILCVCTAVAPRGVDERLELRLDPRLDAKLLICDRLADPPEPCGGAMFGVVGGD
jgi:hypothetical protein